MSRSVRTWSTMGALLLLLFAAGCTKERVEVPGKSSSKAVDPLEGFTRYIIPAGSQYSQGNNFALKDLSSYRFQAYFDSSAIYHFNDADQYDINKLSGFSDNGGSHLQYSARFGWRWSDGRLRLFAFVHNSGEMQWKEISAIALNKVYTCSIAISGNKYIFKVEELKKSVTMERQATTATSRGYQLFPYFGGNKPAPHQVDIWLKYL